MVLPADKGRASVVMDTDTYHTKMSSLIENGPYQLLNKDPTDPSDLEVIRETTNLEAERTSIGGRLQQDQASTQTAA